MNRQTIETFISRVRNAPNYKPTLEEKQWGVLSSKESKGFWGIANRLIATVCRQPDADLVGFLKNRNKD